MAGKRWIICTSTCSGAALCTGRRGKRAGNKGPREQGTKKAETSGPTRPGPSQTIAELHQDTKRARPLARPFGFSRTLGPLFRWSLPSSHRLRNVFLFLFQSIAAEQVRQAL